MIPRTTLTGLADYAERADLSAELQQLIGRVRRCEQYDDHVQDVLIVGERGIVVAGPDAKHHEAVLSSFLSLQARSLFAQALFVKAAVCAQPVMLMHGVLLWRYFVCGCSMEDDQIRS